MLFGTLALPMARHPILQACLAEKTSLVIAIRDLLMLDHVDMESHS